MRIIQYSMHLDSDRKNVLVKESSKNCPQISSRLDSPQKIADLMNLEYNASILAEEYVWMLAMNTRGNLIGLFEISHGSVNKTCASPREIFTRLCTCGAVHFVLVHNHPGGDCSPSVEDTQVTETMEKCGNLMEIPLMDHIIIAENGYYSFKENK